jgi:hypothetical protein
MSSSSLIRLGGLAALVGFVLMDILEVVYQFAFPDTVAKSVTGASNTWFVVNLLYTIALLICLLGLVGLYARQAEQTGVLGLIAFLMTFFGLALLLAWEWVDAFVVPLLAHAAPSLLDQTDQRLTKALITAQLIQALLLFVGLLLFSVVSLRAAVLPRGAAALILVGGLSLILSLLLTGLLGVKNPVVDLLLGLLGLLGGLGLPWMGYAVWSRPSAAAEATMPMTAGGPSIANP